MCVFFGITYLVFLICCFLQSLYITFLLNISQLARIKNLTHMPASDNRPNFSFKILTKLQLQTFVQTRPKPAYGRQGLDWDRWVRIQFSQVHFGAKLDSTDLLWSRHSRGVQLTSFGPKNVTSLTGGPTDLLWSKKRHVTNGGSNWPFRCLDCRLVKLWRDPLTKRKFGAPKSDEPRSVVGTDVNTILRIMQTFFPFCGW